MTHMNPPTPSPSHLSPDTRTSATPQPVCPTPTRSAQRRAALMRTKIKLQGPGWLPYLPPAAVGLRLADPEPRRRDDIDDFELMRVRRACRSFQHRGLTEADRREVLRSIRELIRPEGLIGTNTVRLEHLVAPTLTTWPTTGAREFIVAVAPHDYDRVSVVDVGRALERVVLDATRQGVATCCIGPGTDQSEVEDLLGERFVAGRDHVICICALGYRSRFEPLVVRIIAKVQSGRRPLAELFFADSRLRTPLPVAEAPFSRFEGCYEAARWAPSAFNTQPTRCAAVPAADGRSVERFDFYTATASRYYAPVALGIWCGNWEVGCAALGLTGHFEALPAGRRGRGRGPRPAAALPRELGARPGAVSRRAVAAQCFSAPSGSSPRSAKTRFATDVAFSARGKPQ
jgi:nitroreductase